jgi:hypothetical protein
MQSANLALEGARRNLEASTTAGAQIAPVTSADEVQKQICDREIKGNISWMAPALVKCGCDAGSPSSGSA